MKQIAILGPTASGKSDLALTLAKNHNALILSIDSLSVYKEIDIASAKPSKAELSEVTHYGVNAIFPNEPFSVSTFINSYQQAKEDAIAHHKNLIIVGGTGFYLKTLLSGLSTIPNFSQETLVKTKEMLCDVQKTHQLLYKIDPEYFANIADNDRYRLEKMLPIYLETGVSPSQWFKENPPKPIIKNLDLFEIDVKRDILRQRIQKRTAMMSKSGLIDEICYLERQYSRGPNAMSAIGIVEVLEYLDGFVSKEVMIENIVTHTAQLAKRQQTFNRTQFENQKLLSVDAIFHEAEAIFNSTT